MDFFAHFIDSWAWFVYFCFTSKETRQNQATACSCQHQDYPFILSVERFCHKRKHEKSHDRLGKYVCNSLEIRIKLKLAPTSTLGIRKIN